MYTHCLILVTVLTIVDISSCSVEVKSRRNNLIPIPYYWLKNENNDVEEKSKEEDDESVDPDDVTIIYEDQGDSESPKVRKIVPKDQNTSKVVSELYFLGDSSETANNDKNDVSEKPTIEHNKLISNDSTTEGAIETRPMKKVGYKKKTKKKSLKKKLKKKKNSRKKVIRKKGVKKYKKRKIRRKVDKKQIVHTRVINHSSINNNSTQTTPVVREEDRRNKPVDIIVHIKMKD